MKKALPTIFTSLGALFLFAPTAHAIELINNALESSIASTGLGNTSPTTTAAQIINAFLGVLGIIALVLIIYAGFRWMTAAGNEERVNDAKKTLQAATIGLIIVLGSYGIALYVFSTIESATGFA